MIDNSIQMSEEIGLYLDELRADWPGMGDVWLLRTPAPKQRGSTWELLVFADENTVDALSGDKQRHRSDVVLLVVVDGDRFRSAWGESRSGRLSDLNWEQQDADTANYEADGGEQASQSAVRVR